ncbi:hypothetical protein VNO80_35199 [Phaseolus coccineus]|uniref:Uncharacterized protein n=1 Tax=Phaseolus coccineus TaxID=3886 RepID=A0AAN9KQH5_PHACN
MWEASLPVFAMDLSPRYSYHVQCPNIDMPTYILSYYTHSPLLNACALARAVTSGVSSADEASKGRRLKIHSCTEPLTRQVDRQQAQLDLLIYDASFFHMSGSLIFVSELKPLPFTP